MLTIRPAKLSDAPAIQAIYAPYVEKTAITFEYEVPSVQEFEARIRKTLEKFPYLVVEEDSRVLGYAYASTYYARTAYDWTTELSIYLHEDARGRGLGNQLYDALEEELEKRGFLRFLACIAVPKLLIFQKLATSLSNGTISSGCKKSWMSLLERYSRCPINLKSQWLIIPAFCIC